MVSYENLDEVERNSDDDDLGCEFMWMWQRRSDASDVDDHGSGGSKGSGGHNVQVVGR
jgi:hypothetical protein